APEPGKPWSMSYEAMGFTNSDIDEHGHIKAGAPSDQLYNLASDLAQSKNVVTENPDQARAMKARLKEITGNADTKSSAE
ncbi:MAG: hypothetical protein ABI318_23640, partial [Chthoniobacteraceae bacterium]